MVSGASPLQWELMIWKRRILHASRNERASVAIKTSYVESVHDATWQGILPPPILLQLEATHPPLFLVPEHDIAAPFNGQVVTDPFLREAAVVSVNNPAGVCL